MSISEAAKVLICHPPHLHKSADIPTFAYKIGRCNIDLFIAGFFRFIPSYFVFEFYNAVNSMQFSWTCCPSVQRGRCIIKPGAFLNCNPSRDLNCIRGKNPQVVLVKSPYVHVATRRGGREQMYLNTNSAA